MADFGWVASEIGGAKSQGSRKFYRSGGRGFQSRLGARSLHAEPRPRFGEVGFVDVEADDFSNAAIARALRCVGETEEWVHDYEVVADSVEAHAPFGDANASDLSDTDGDGLTLLHEYALCLNPQSPDTVPGAELRGYAEGARLSMTFIRDPLRDDITIAVQVSDAPAGPWLTIASSVNGGPVTGAGYVSGETPDGGPKSIEVRDVINLADAPQRFLRLHLTH